MLDTPEFKEKVAALNLGTFSDEDVGKVQDLLADIRLQDSNWIRAFGDGGQDASTSITVLADMMEVSASAKLAQTLNDMLTLLKDADPQRVAKKPSWWHRFWGKDLEVRVMYDHARTHIDAKMAIAEQLAVQVAAIIEQLDAMEAGHNKEVQNLRIYLAAGELFLRDTPTVAHSADPLQFDNPQDRFRRKLQNMATLYASQQMSIAQMRLAKAQAVDLLDRQKELATVLIPVWRQNILAICTHTINSPEIIGAATRAHEALVKSLSATTNGIALVR